MTEYISREAAYNAIINNYTIDDQLKDLYSVPAADVAPVVHAHWGRGSEDGRRKCSHCGMYEHERNYCGYCGAKMDGDGE